jgi:FkbM family methyltransferase
MLELYLYRGGCEFNKKPEDMKRFAHLLRVVFVERRMPGAIYTIYGNLLNRIGIRTVSTTTPNGFVVRCLTNCIGLFHEVWTTHDYDIEGLSLGVDSVVIDIGANQGFFTLYAARDGAKIFAFEPNADTFRMLRENVARNSLQDRVVAFNEAVTGREGLRDLYIGFDSKGNMLSGTASIVNSNRGGDSVVVESARSTTLDKIFEDNMIDRCDLLKMDCEGAEYEILANASQRTFDKIGSVSMEFHDGRGQEAADALERFGFEIISKTDAEFGMIKARNGKVSSQIRK